MSFILFTLLALDLPKVELQLLALQDVAISTATLPRAGGDTGYGRRRRVSVMMYCRKLEWAGGGVSQSNYD